MSQRVNESGQTLIETIIAVGVIAIVVTALIGMGVVAMRTAGAARNQSQAVKLANEGMELVRSARDQNTWSGFRALSWGSESVGIFTRSTTVVDEGGTDKVKVTVNVRWTESSGTKAVSVSSYLTDWR